MKIDKIRSMSPAKLSAEELNLKKELFNLRFQLATGQLENVGQIKEIKRNIAKIKTVIRENELKADK